MTRGSDASRSPTLHTPTDNDYYSSTTTRTTPEAMRIVNSIMYITLYSDPIQVEPVGNRVGWENVQHSIDGPKPK